jgi:hypothetical protein
MPLLVCMPDELGCVVGVDRVHHVEEVISIRQAAFRHLVREVLGEVRRVLHLRPQSLDSQLIVHGDVHETHIFDLE